MMWLKILSITIEEIGFDYGADVAHLVEGLTKIDMIRDAELIPSHSDQKLVVSALTFRKMLLASIEDVRVLVVKLCDRLHNMLTLDALPPHKQHRIAEETLVVYAPIAHRLGISFLKNLLEDLSFQYLFVEDKLAIESYLEENFRSINERLSDFCEKLTQILLSNGMCQDDFEILSRVKHHYSIYLKMQRKGISIDEILDLLAVRILVKEPIDCYKVLGMVHLNFQPLSARFKDYIAIPKENGYQTLHTTVFDTDRQEPRHRRCNQDPGPQGSEVLRFERPEARSQQSEEEVTSGKGPFGASPGGPSSLTIRSPRHNRPSAIPLNNLPGPLENLVPLRGTLPFS